MKQFITLVILAGGIFGCATTMHSQPASATAIDSAISNNKWVFTALQMSPQVGRSSTVNGIYTVELTDSVFTVYLPYRGRATIGADVWSGKGPLDFNTRDYTLEASRKAADEWEVHIKPNSIREVQDMYFHFYTNGTATLKVILTNRSGINYNGSILPAQSNKKKKRRG